MFSWVALFNRADFVLFCSDTRLNFRPPSTPIKSTFVTFKTALFPLLGVLALPLAAPVSAATLSDNLSEPFSDASNIDDQWWDAQQFSTTASAFRITDVAVQVTKEINTVGQLVLAIYDASGTGGVPGAQVAFVGSVDAGSIGTASALLDLPNLNIALSANTDYFLVLKGSNVGTSDTNPGAFGSFYWDYTDSATGTGAGFSPNYTITSDGGGTWDPLSPDFPGLMRIEADGGAVTAAVPELDAASGTGALALLLGALGLAGERRRARSV